MVQESKEKMSGMQCHRKVTLLFMFTSHMYFLSYFQLMLDLNVALAAKGSLIIGGNWAAFCREGHKS